MKAWDIFEELGNLEDELILEAPPKRHFYGRNGLRIALVAAVTLLLMGTVLAVGLGVAVGYGKENIYLQGVSLGQEPVSVSYHTAQLHFDLKPVSIENGELLSQQLTEAWLKSSDLQQFSGCELLTETGEVKSFEAVTQAEEFFGLELMDSPQLNEFVRRIYVTLSVSDPQKAAESYEKTGKISPDGLIFYLSLRRGDDPDTALDSRLVSESGISIYVPLTEAFVEKESTQCLYATEQEGKFQESGLRSKAGISILLLENPNKGSYSRSGYGVWCQGGIAYIAHLKTYPDSYATPLSLLAPILEQLQ